MSISVIFEMPVSYGYNEEVEEIEFQGRVRLGIHVATFPKMIFNYIKEVEREFRDVMVGTRKEFEVPVLFRDEDVELMGAGDVAVRRCFLLTPEEFEELWRQFFRKQWEEMELDGHTQLNTLINWYRMFWGELMNKIEGGE